MGLPKTLITAIALKRVVPFIGAGYSYHFGYPSWNDLLICLASELEISVERRDIENQNPLEVAEALWLRYKEEKFHSLYDEMKQEIVKDNKNIEERMIENYLKQNTINRLAYDFNEIVCKCLQDNVDKERIDSSIVEKLKTINKFNFKSVVTTNFDKVIENEVFPDIKPVFPGLGEELKHDESSFSLYKIHGDIGNPKTIVLTHSQYYNFMHNLGYFKSKLYTLFTSNVILMMGYGFKDLNIHEIYFQYRKDYKAIIEESNQNQPDAYLVLTNYDKEKLGSYYSLYVEFLKGCGITIIDSYDNLCDFIEELYNEVHTYEQSKTINDVVSTKNINKVIEVLKGIITNDRVDYSLEQDEVLDLFELIALIFRSPKILSKLDFEIEYDFEGTLSVEIANRLLKESINISDKIVTVKDKKQFSSIVFVALTHARKESGDWYAFPQRFELFLKLCKV